MKCPTCGNEVRNDERFCQYCGENNDYYIEPVKSSPEPIRYSNPSPSPTNNYSSNYNNSNYNPYPPQQQTIIVREESSAISILALIFCILGGWLGLLFAIIGLCTYKEEANRSRCIVALCIAGVWFVLGFILGLALAV